MQGIELVQVFNCKTCQQKHSANLRFQAWIHQDCLCADLFVTSSLFVCRWPSLSAGKALLHCVCDQQHCAKQASTRATRKHCGSAAASNHEQHAGTTLQLTLLKKSVECILWCHGTQPEKVLQSTHYRSGARLLNFSGGRTPDAFLYISSLLVE